MEGNIGVEISCETWLSGRALTDTFVSLWESFYTADRFRYRITKDLDEPVPAVVAAVCIQTLPTSQPVQPPPHSMKYHASGRSQ